jgi:GDP/UDP-N,N'-diacetylbacillosamine 2-epimerase (hydrolysing)
VQYRDRVIQLGESPEKVFCVGALGIDTIINQKLITKRDLESSLAVKFQKKNLLITYHPVTLEKKTSSRDFEEILMALSTLDDTSLFFTMPNADQDNAIIFSMIESFVKDKKNAHAFKSMGSVRYLSCMKYVDAVVGNSSSGIIEAPSLKIPTINVGNRQKGRIQAESILNCSPDRFQILEAIYQIYSKPFQELLRKVKNPYGKGGASTKIFKILKSQHFDNLINKSFFDVKLK